MECDGDREDRVEDPEDDDEEDRAFGVTAASAWRWRVLVVQRADEALTQLELSGGGFEHVVAVCVPGNALRDLAPLVHVAKTLRALNAGENALATLPGAAFWSAFARLEVCLLGDNTLAAWDDLVGLEAAPMIKWLSLAGNPFMARANARAFVVNQLATLQALDDLVVADHERVQFARPTLRFPTDAALSSRQLGLLPVPHEFPDDPSARRFFDQAARTVAQRFASNSACLTLQRTARGFLSRRARLPLFSRVRALITRVQRIARGFLLRCRVQREFVALVEARGQAALLQLDPSESLLVPRSARRGLRRLRELVQRWRLRFRARKRAVAVAKIRFWCQMVRQRQKFRAQQLVRERQELLVYFSPALAPRVLAAALRAAHRDPFLLTMDLATRTAFLAQRCAPSGVRVLRAPAARVDDSKASIAALTDPAKARRRRRTEDGAALVRIFASDAALETELLVAEKKLLQDDLSRIRAALRADAAAQQQQQSTASGSTVRPARAVRVHLAQMEGELETRIAICGRKILSACVKLQATRRREPSARSSLAQPATRLRARGFAPNRSERRKFAELQRRAQPAASRERYPALRAFVPWSVDMYLLVLAALSSRSPEPPAAPAAPAPQAAPMDGMFLSYALSRRAHAAVVIQSAWRASRRVSRRIAREVTLRRAAVCVQRWWRQRVGLARRMAFARACVLVGAAVNSRTLFMDAREFRALADGAAWAALPRRWPENALRCALRGEPSRVSISVAAAPLLALRSAALAAQSLHEALASSVDYGARAASAIAAQRCSAVLPAWLPGAPDHETATMDLRAGEDAAARLLREDVDAEPSLLERELLLRGDDGAAGDEFARRNPFRAFRIGHEVAATASRLLHLARSLLLQGSQPSALTAAAPLLVLDATSIVRVRFASVDEARRRALVLLARTFDPVTGAFARLHSLEALIGAALRRHQWSMSQLPQAADAQAALDAASHWLDAQFPSPWWTSVERTIGHIGSTSVFPGLIVSPRPPPPRLTSPTTAERRRDARDRNQRPEEDDSVHAGAPLHLVVSVMSPDRQAMISAAMTSYDGVSQPQQPRPPPRVASPTTADVPTTPSTPSSGSSRHQLLANRLGTETSESLADREVAQLQARMYHVRDLREERERAMEALIVDRRMEQRERAAACAGARLDVDVALVKRKYARDIERLQRREGAERDRLAAARTKLTHAFERQFVAQSGALMRRAAREAVANAAETRAAAQAQQTREVRGREADARDRRMDAKSWWYARNQRARADVADGQHARVQGAAAAARARLVRVQERRREDDDIKNMLRLV